MMRSFTGNSAQSSRLVALSTFCFLLAACNTSRENGATVVHAPPSRGPSMMNELASRSAMTKVDAATPKAEPRARVQPTRPKRRLLAKAELPDRPALEARLYLVEYPPDSEGSVPGHSEQCVGYVLEGRFACADGDGSAVVKQTGEGFVDLPNQPHELENLAPIRPLRLLLLETLPKDARLQPLPDQAAVTPGSTPPASGQSAPDQGAFAARAPVPPSDGVLPPQSGPLPEVKRTLLAQRAIDDLPGMESRIYLIEFPPGAASRLHLHTTTGLGYVLEGRFESAFGDDAPTIKRAGESFIDLPNRPHHFRNPDPVLPLRFVVGGAFHRGEPLFQLVAHHTSDLKR